MGTLNLAGLPDPALLLVDSPPIIYFLEDRARFGERFEPLFDAHAAGSPLFRRVVTPYDFEGMSRESEVLIRIRAGERCTPNLTRTVCLYMLEFGWTWLEEGT